MKSFWRLVGYVKNYSLNVSLNILCNILMAFFTVVSIPAIIPFLQILFERETTVQKPASFEYNINSVVLNIKYELNQLIETSGRETALMYICLFIVLLFFFKNFFRYFSMFFMAPVRHGVVRDLRQQLYDKVLILPIGYFSEERKGDLIAKASTDVQEVEWSILNALEAIFREPLIIIGCLIFMIYVSPQLTIFVFVLMIFTVFIIGGIGRTLKKRSSAVQDRLADIISILEETLSGMRIIKGFNAEEYQHSKFSKENNSYRWLLTRLLWRRDLSSPLSEFLGILVVSVLLWYGSSIVFSGQMGAETFFAFLFAFFNLLDPSKKFATAYYNVQKGIAAIQRVEKVLDAEVTIKDPENPASIAAFEKNIEYQHIYFKYPTSERWIIDNINLTISKGQVIALVGNSGAGKSTLADLLPRFYDVQEGGIFIDGKNIKSYSLHDLRALMGIVSQDPILFNDTIFNNIVFGMKGCSEEEVINAAKVANAHDFILNTENGYQTVIGDRGSKLSGGQRQRLTIARAVLRNPPILILDEATSSLDSESEKLVQNALQKVLKNRTAIVIAHRLSTIQHADQIVVMQDGKIVEQGKHSDLLKGGSVYKKLVELQAF